MTSDDTPPKIAEAANASKPAGGKPSRSAGAIPEPSDLAAESHSGGVHSGGFPPKRTPKVNRNAWLLIPWALGPAAIMVLAATMSVGEKRTVYLPIADIPVPETCGMRRAMDVDCPGCGLTRTFIHLAHGDLQRAWQLHPVGIALFVFVALQIPLAVVHFCSSDIEFRRKLTRGNERALILLAVAVMARWGFLLLTGNIF